MIIMDSGLGGISVVRAIRAAQPEHPLIYLADTAAFPYGKLRADEIGARAECLLNALLAQHAASCIVLACNTLSTLCLESLRTVLPYPIIGTVPAIKTAAHVSHSRRFTLLATPNTAQSHYIADLIRQFAQGCMVDCYGAPNIAFMAEAYLLGNALDYEALRREVMPAFFDDEKGKTDAIILGCTHYPLIVDALRAVSPWSVEWIDSSKAIAKRALSQPDASSAESVAYVSSEAAMVEYEAFFAREGFVKTNLLVA